MSQFFTYYLYNRITVYCVIGAALVLFGCQPGERQTDEASDPEIPERIDNLGNLTAYSPEESADTVELVRETIFGNNENVYIRGFMSNVAIDKLDRVFIAGTKPGEAAIYVFQPNGKYITSIGRHGRGPEEFLTIADMKIRGNQLYVYDNHQRRISVFSLDDFSVSEEMLLSDDKVISEEEWAGTQPHGDLYVRTDSTFLMKFRKRTALNEDRYFYYYKLSKAGEILPKQILQLTRPYLYEPGSSQTREGFIRAPRTMPFSRSSLIAVSSDGPIYTAWTEDFLIKVYDEDGNYQRAFYYPYNKSPLVLSGIDISEEKKDLINENSNLVPDSWPVVHTMELDDENRLWIATITDSDSTFKWWVLDKEGKLLARFEKSGERLTRSARTKPLNVIKNGYFYTRERDSLTNANQIVKHRIEFKAQ